MSVSTAEASRVGSFYSKRGAATTLHPHKYRILEATKCMLKLSRPCMAGVEFGGGMMSVADVRSVSDAEALLAQLDREEVRLWLAIIGDPCMED